jgi:serine/threonine protein kinase
LTGLPPFYDENTNEMYRKILQEPLRFPEEVGSEARSLLTQLLDRDPARRLGVNGAQEIKSHPFFARHIDWRKLLAKKIQPPFKPAVVSECLKQRMPRRLLSTFSARRALSTLPTSIREFNRSQYSVPAAD